MRGFAVLDCQPGSPLVAIWLTKRVGHTSVEHTNAVLLDMTSDAKARVKAHSLTRDVVLVLTEGSVPDLFLVSGTFLTRADFDELGLVAHELGLGVAAGVDAYVKRTRKYALNRPNFPSTPVSSEPPSADATPTERALNLANHVQAAWVRWLVAEDERSRRTTDGRGNSPWMMPPELATTGFSEFPVEWATQLKRQPLEALDA